MGTQLPVQEDVFVAAALPGAAEDVLNGFCLKSRHWLQWRREAPGQFGSDLSSLFFSAASGFTDMNNMTNVSIESSTVRISSFVPTNVSNQETSILSTLESTTLNPIFENSSETTAAISGKARLSQAPEGCYWCLGKALDVCRPHPASTFPPRWKHAIFL